MVKIVAAWKGDKHINVIIDEIMPSIGDRFIYSWMDDIWSLSYTTFSQEMLKITDTKKVLLRKVIFILW